MTAPHRTPNPATTVQPERSSRKVARKSPLGWLPWALLGALALLLGLVLLAYNAVDDDGPEGAAGDSLGQVSGSDGDSAVGSDGEDADGEGGAEDEGESSGGGEGGAEALAALSEKALVGGGGLAAAPAARTAGAEALASQPGTAGAVLFDVGEAEINAEGQKVVDAAIAAVEESGATKVSVVGHTDVIAGDPTNDPLSQMRADAVAKALAAGLPGVDITTAAKGQEEPIASNDTDAGRQLNRRAVITATA